MGIDIRCRNCEEPVDVLDLCEICEMKPTVIEPVEFKLCERGHFMRKGAGKSRNGWLCTVCRSISQAKSRARRRERVA